VHGRIEEVAPAAKRVGVTSDPVVALDHEHAASHPRQERGDREAADAGPHDDGVVCVALRLAVESHERTTFRSRFRGPGIDESTTRQ
jgi:hypothetical protein